MIVLVSARSTERILQLSGKFETAAKIRPRATCARLLLLLLFAGLVLVCRRTSGTEVAGAKRIGRCFTLGGEGYFDVIELPRFAQVDDS